MITIILLNHVIVQQYRSLIVYLQGSIEEPRSWATAATGATSTKQWVTGA